jgi:pimeloyl-ACP methyl ester carboxylesterase
LVGSISRAVRDGERLAVLELVSASGPATRSGRAVPHRRHYSAGHGRPNSRSNTGLHRRTLCWWRAAAVMGSEYADLYAAMGIHSGLPPSAAQDIPSAFAAMRRGARVWEGAGGKSIVPTIVFHGDQDRTVSPQNAKLILARFVPRLAELEKRVEQDQVPAAMAIHEPGTSIGRVPSCSNYGCAR